MIIDIYQVDAFATQVFGGNPAAVCPLPGWLDDRLLQAIATENNLSETAYLVPVSDKRYALRWFTPAAEVDLCGHATLAAAHVLFEHLGVVGRRVDFVTRSGCLTVEQDGARLTMDFPVLVNTPVEIPALQSIIGVKPAAVFSGQDVIVVLDDESAVRDLHPDPYALRKLPCRGVAFTAPGDGCDFVSRAFYPKLDIAEDPVTGSVHCQLAPYWAGRFDKTRLLARQISRRGGELECRLLGDRVHIGGQAITFMTGQICLPD